MVKGDQFEQAFAFCDGATPKLVGLAQHGFASSHRVFAQSCGVFDFELALLTALSSPSRLHE